MPEAVRDCGATRERRRAATAAEARPVRRDMALKMSDPHHLVREAETGGAGRLALFLDVDGTLLEIAETPDQVIVEPRVPQVLGQLHSQLDGALALVSGRSIGQLDGLFSPTKLPCAGGHGSERRDARGHVHRLTSCAGGRLDRVRAQVAQFAAAHPGVLLEDKRFALALHYRRRPELAAAVNALMSRARAELGPDFRAQRGVLVHELVPADATKGAAVEAFMREPPFTGRQPIFIGDDLTDLSGFEAAQHHGGQAIAVGHRVRAKWHLPDARAVIEWLESLARSLARAGLASGDSRQ